MSDDGWKELGAGYPEPAGKVVTKTLFDVLAPCHGSRRLPAYELGHEETPTPEEVWDLAVKLTRAIERVKEAKFDDDSRRMGR